MLSRNHRLPRFDIPRVMKTGKRIAGNGFALIYSDSRNRGQNSQEDSGNHDLSRFAFIVSKKTDKRATVRNRIKRILSESVRHLLPSISPTIDGVFIGNKALAQCSQAETEIRVAKIFHEIHIS